MKQENSYASHFKILRDRDPDAVRPPVRRALSCDLRELRVDRWRGALADHSRRCASPRACDGVGMGLPTSGGIIAGMASFERRATTETDRTIEVAIKSAELLRHHKS